jgi:hypothetical protein
VTALNRVAADVHGAKPAKPSHATARRVSKGIDMADLRGDGGA